MNNIELIQSLLKDLDELQNRDEHKLDALTRRSEMIIRKIFGNDSKYLKDLKDIDFFPRIYPSTEEYYQEKWISGKNQMLNLFKTMIEELKIFSPIQTKKEPKLVESRSKKNVFVVHGHDEEMKQSVARTLEKLELTAIILHEQPNKGRTTIEKFSDYSDVGFAIVLLSPDDIGYERVDKIENAKSRARQNVVFELGYFIGKLGRENVLALYKPDEKFEMPTDYSGVLYVPYELNGRWKFDLIKELKACGYSVDANKLI